VVDHHDVVGIDGKTRYSFACDVVHKFHVPAPIIHRKAHNRASGLQHSPVSLSQIRRIIAMLAALVLRRAYLCAQPFGLQRAAGIAFEILVPDLADGDCIVSDWCVA
jgi:hypothetical protein